MKAILKLIKKIMLELKLNYQFLEWNGTLKFPFIIGEIDELPNENEDGKNRYQFILTLTDNNSTLMELLEVKEKIKNKFKYNYKEDGIVISYTNSQVIPTGDENLKRMQINLEINTWEI